MSIDVRVQVPSLAPARRKRCIACDELFCVYSEISAALTSPKENACRHAARRNARVFSKADFLPRELIAVKFPVFVDIRKTIVVQSDYRCSQKEGESAVSTHHVSLTPAEWSVMECLWEAAPLTGREVTQKMQQRCGWSRSTTLTLLSRMEAKGAVAGESGRRQEGLSSACVPGGCRPAGD